jgi:hypothetical protein
MLGSLALFGRLDIEIVEATLDGRERSFDDVAAPFRIEGGRYANPGLGLEIDAPRGWSFRDADSVWPSPKLLGLLGPAGARAELLEVERPQAPTPARTVEAALEALGTFAAPRALRLRSDSGWSVWRTEASRRVTTAWLDGDSVYVLIVDGDGARAAADRLAGAMRWNRPPGAWPPG